MAGMGVELLHNISRFLILVLDGCNSPRESQPVSGQEFLGYFHCCLCPLHYSGHPATISGGGGVPREITFLRCS